METGRQRECPERRRLGTETLVLVDVNVFAGQRQAGDVQAHVPAPHLLHGAAVALVVARTVIPLPPSLTCTREV